MSHVWIHSHRSGFASSRDSRYHGLKNQGATSNLNSVLQVLFMTRDFREAVKRCPDDCGGFADHQLNNLFENLKKHKAETVEITQMLGIDNVDEQHDAAEYLEKILTLTSDEASQIFKGEVVHRTVCECGAVTDEKKPFWNLPLPLRSSSDRNYSVVDGIEDFFKVSHLVGDDQLFCEKCESKSDSTAECVIERHPEVLMLLLKRFEFSYHQMSYVKNRCVVEVPLTVEIPQNHKYELYAFVDHFGSLRKGHYTATIKSEEDEDSWHNFNDSGVAKVDHQPFKRQMSEKSSSAYLLFYRKIKSNKEAGTKEDKEASNICGPPTDNKYGAEVEDQWKREKTMYNIFVHGLKGEKIPIDICKCKEDLQKVTVKDLKEKIFEVYPKIRDDKNLQLKFVDKILEGQTTLLAKYGIKDTSVIHMVFRADEEEGPVENQGGGMGDKEGNTRRSMEDVRLSDFQTQTSDMDGTMKSMEN